MASEAEKVDLTSLKINRTAPVQNPGDGSGKTKWIVITIAAIAAIVLIVMFLPSFGSTKKITTVQATLTFSSQANAILTASGYIVPQRQAAVASKGTGRLVFLAVEEGDHVKKGDVIARLESADVEAQLNQNRANLDAGKAQLEQAKAELNKSKKEFDRNENLWKSKVITDSEYDIVKAAYESGIAVVNSAQANVAALEATVRAAEVGIENTVIRAPFDGTVLTKNADVGEIVAPFAAGANSRGNVVTIADMASLQLEADVSESNIDRIKLNQPCEIVLDAFPERRYRGIVWKIVPTADRAKATILTKIKFLEIDSKVLPEMSAKVTFLAEALPDSAVNQLPKLTIPVSTVVNKNGKRSVFLVQDNRVKEIAIEVSGMVGERMEVTQGLVSGDKLVDRPSADLHDGDKVEIEKK
ncbi:efflux RND transporter periplasmic adaptor subunit [bacterium]|nr:efflux RND transporter periplasmic adaptor subunit [bacterium]